MGRKGREHRNVRSISINFNGKIVEIQLNLNERIQNEEDLNLIPSLYNPNNDKKIKTRKSRRTTKTENNKKDKNQNEEINNKEDKENMNDINDINNNIDNDIDTNYTFNDENYIEETLENEYFENETFMNENTEFNLFNIYEDNNFDNEETNDLFFDFEQSQFF